MDLIPRLCRRAILLDRGRIEASGPASQIVQRYLDTNFGIDFGDDLSEKPWMGTGAARFTRLRLVDDAGKSIPVHQSGTDLTLEMHIESDQDFADVELAVSVLDLGGTRLFTSWTRECGYSVTLKRGLQVFRCRFRDVRLRPGHRISIYLWMAAREELHAIHNARVLEIVDGPGTSNFSTDKTQGVILLDYDWECTACPDETGEADAFPAQPLRQTILD
jgi:hypothetical protein